MSEQTSLELHRLPPEAARVVQEVEPDPYLLAHLVLVHDTAFHLVEAISENWPDLVLDTQMVLLGAALHDIGKVRHPEEMSAPGSRHHEAGFSLLQELGLDEGQARFARTHGAWRREEALTLEDLVVALADVIWAGGRERELEDMVAEGLNAVDGRELWETFLDLDDILTRLTQDAELRLVWQTQFAPVRRNLEQEE